MKCTGREGGCTRCTKECAGRAALQLAAGNWGDDGHLVAAPQRLLLPGAQVLLVQAQHKAALQLAQRGVLHKRRGSERGAAEQGGGWLL